MDGDQRRFRILNLIGIIDQLATTRANQTLATAGLPWPQFLILNHFSHRPAEPKMVTAIATAFQQPQPGITKTVHKLLDKGWLRAEPDPADGRSRKLFLTPAGMAAHAAATRLLAPQITAAFANWSEDEIGTVLPLLERLRLYLDSHR